MEPRRSEHAHAGAGVYHSAEASQYVAAQIAAAIRRNNAAGKATVLGLATGSTPIGSIANSSACTRKNNSIFRAS